MNNAPSTDISFAQLGIGSVLKFNQLVVPQNQREYSWTTKEVRTLFQDYAKAISDGERSYFLGTIVTILKSGDVLEVSDGQQRLATTAILLSAFRDYLNEKEPIIAESINNEFLTGIERSSRARIPKLRLNVDDNEYFRSRLTGQTPIPAPSKPSHRLLDAAFNEAKEQVSRIVADLNEKDHGDRINQWIDFIQSRALVVLLKVQNEANAYRMFETLNDRGLRTSQADLVKNYLFGRAGGRIQEVQQKWASMRGALETMEDDDITILFLRHALTLIRGLVRETQIYDAVQNYAQSPNPVVTFASSLEALASSYVSIFNPDHEKWNDHTDATRKALGVLNLFDIRPLRPLILAISHKFTKREQTETALKFCISLGVRLMIASSTRTSSVEEGVAEAAHKIYTSEIAEAEALYKKLKSIVPTDEQFSLAFQNATVSNRKLAKYYIRSLEMVAKGEQEPWHIPNDDKAIINLEHVLPEKPEGNWPQFTDEQVRLYYRRIGNLALLRASENSSVKSESFDVKRLVYQKSPYVLTEEIGKNTTWTIKEITTRQERLAKYALKAWPEKW